MKRTRPSVSSKKTKSIREKARQSAQERLNDPDYLAVKLNKAPAFNHSLKLHSSQYKKVVQLYKEITDKKTEGKKGEERITDLSILFANLLSLRGKPLFISMSPNSWTKSRYRKAGQFTIEAVRLLLEKGLIERDKGYHFEDNSRVSRIWATKKLLQMFPKKDIIEFDPVELVILKDINKKPIPYPDTKETNKIRKILQKTNEINRKAQIIFDDIKLDTNLRAIYNVKFSKGGRFYAGGEEYFQGISKEDRAEITINGEPIIELDFSSLHPRLIYAMEGIQFSLDEDPYSKANDDPELRSVLKLVLLAMLNSKNKDIAISAGNYKLKGDRNLYHLLKRKKISIADLVRQFEEAHSRIGNYFYRDIGKVLMNKDSKIALSVIGHFTKQNIPILPIHDSFIVQGKYREELRKIMSESFEKVTGGFLCPIT